MEVQPQINQYCKDNPGAKQVLVYLPPDSWCFCDCASALAVKPEARGDGEAGKEAQGTSPCASSDCNTDPRLIEMCQGLPPGQPTLIRDKEGKLCTCECWGGALAPYQIANAEGDYVSLDEIPVGTFVKACGLDIEWVEMMVRYAGRPMQNSPQDAIQVTIGEATLVVPTSHLFLTYQKKLILAEKMIDSIALMGSDGSPVPVDKVEAISTKNAFQFIATVDGKPPKNLAYHLLDSEGVVSADYAVQQAYQKQELPEALLAFAYDYMPKSAPRFS